MTTHEIHNVVDQSGHLGMNPRLGDRDSVVITDASALEDHDESNRPIDVEYIHVGVSNIAKLQHEINPNVEEVNIASTDFDNTRTQSKDDVGTQKFDDVKISKVDKPHDRKGSEVFQNVNLSLLSDRLSVHDGHGINLSSFREASDDEAEEEREQQQEPKELEQEQEKRSQPYSLKPTKKASSAYFSNAHMNSHDVINFPSAWGQVKNIDLSKEKREVFVENNHWSFFEKLLMNCSYVNKLPAPLMSEKDHILAFSKVKFNDNDPLHFRILRTIFVKLTKNYNCPRYGEHWEMIGFMQDPATDLRGVGMLGLLQILAFITSHEEFIREAYDFSLQDSMRPPLCSSMLGATLITIELAKNCKLNGLINSQRSAINAINNMYFAIYYKIYKSCKEQGGNLLIAYPLIYKQIRETAMSNHRLILNEFAQAMEG